MPGLDRDTARDWIERWDRQQEESLPDREDRFTALIDAVQEGTERPDPIVLDIGCGPGSLAVRLLARLCRPPANSGVDSTSPRKAEECARIAGNSPRTKLPAQRPYSAASRSGASLPPAADSRAFANASAVSAAPKPGAAISALPWATCNCVSRCRRVASALTSSVAASAVNSACASAISGISNVGEKPSNAGSRTACASTRRAVDR